VSEREVTIASGNHLLEAGYDQSEGGATAVICHPHPLYGGDMDNNVVLALKETLRIYGWGTLRFNFRGVAGSTGQHGGGQGDVEDLLAAAAFLRQQTQAPVHVAGYSYGAWIALKATRLGLQPATLILVSPPVDFLDFRDISLPDAACLITLGDRDDFCSIPSLTTWINAQRASESSRAVEIIPRCDHFYGGREADLSVAVVNFLQRQHPPESA
jgi:uncharacterized protein